jgi:hypothetical protein
LPIADLKKDVPVFQLAIGNRKSAMNKRYVDAEES